MDSNREEPNAIAILTFFYCFPFRNAIPNVVALDLFGSLSLNIAIALPNIMKGIVVYLF